MKSSSLLFGAISLASAAALQADESRHPARRSVSLSGDDLLAYENPNTGGKKFTLSQVQNHQFQKADAQSEFIRAHVKFGKELPPSLIKAAEMNPDLNEKFQSANKEPSTGTVGAYPAPNFDSEFVVPVEIGTPPQKTHLNLDTGSADLWTFSSETFPFLAAGHTLYRPEASNTSDLLRGEQWSVTYGDGAGAGGLVYKDRVQVGNTFFDEQAVQTAVQVSYKIAGDTFSSGILGMAKSFANTVRPTQQKTYIENIKDDLALPLFTVNLKKGKPGNYNFGYLDSTEFEQPLQFAPVDPDSPYWQFPVSGYQVGDDSNYQSYDWDSIVDTGTTLLLAPQRIVNDYYSQVDGAVFDPYQGMVVFPCDVVPPSFTFGVDYYRGVIPGDYINYGTANGTHCFGGIQSSEGIGFSVLGDVLLKSQYVVFDLGSDMVGFAKKQL